MKTINTNYPFVKSNFIEKCIFCLKILFVFIFTMFLIIVKIFCDFLLPKYSIHVPQIFHKLLVWMINIKIIVEGKIAKENKGLLFVSNHLSYIDIPILGSLMSVKFVAKNEIARWPIIGRLAKMGNTIFIKRIKSNLVKEKDIIQKELNLGFRVILFPEGTTSDGIRVLKFKSSLLSSIEKNNYQIQPIVINYERINGFPLNRWLKPIIAWYGDMGLKSHLLNVLRLFSIEARVRFLDPIYARDFKDRKSMTFALQNVIYSKYSQRFHDK